MRIPAAQPIIGTEEQAAVLRVMESGMLAQGPEVAGFEADFSEHVDRRHCVAVNSGTSALHLGMVAAGIGPGDEVIVPSFSFAATANSVALAGATPVFADIDPVSFCLDPNDAEQKVTGRTAAIMPVHLYGHPADVHRFRDMCDRRGLLLIEDAAQAHLAQWADRPVGAWGDVAAFSFYPTKNMTSGEGGMVVAKDVEVARQVRLLRNQGMEKRYANEVIGYNARMTDVHAAIGRVQLRKLRAWTDTRRKNAEFLTKIMAGAHGIRPPVAPAEALHVYHQYTVRVENGRRDWLAEQLNEKGIGSGVYYPTPIHELPSFGLSLDLPNTTSACSEVLSLPIHPSLAQSDLAEVGQTIHTLTSETS